MSINKNVDKAAEKFGEFCKKNNVRVAIFMCGANPDDKKEIPGKFKISSENGNDKAKDALRMLAAMLAVVEAQTGESKKKIMKSVSNYCRAEAIKDE